MTIRAPSEGYENVGILGITPTIFPATMWTMSVYQTLSAIFLDRQAIGRKSGNKTMADKNPLIRTGRKMDRTPGILSLKILSIQNCDAFLPWY